MAAFLDPTRSPVPASRGSTVTAASSATAEVPLTKISRKRSLSCDKVTRGGKALVSKAIAIPYSRFNTAATSTARLTGCEKNGRSRDHFRFSDQAHCASDSQGIAKWQVDSMMDWMKQNDYNPVPNWEAIDDLVEKTRMKPSQVAAWASEIGSIISPKYS